MFFSIIDFAKTIPGEPSFKRFPFKDVNPLGGTVKQRLICEPNEAMRAVHAKLIRYIRSLSVDFSSSAASRPGNSPLKNVSRHLGHRYFYLTDLLHAYPSVDSNRLVDMLVTIDPSLRGYESDVNYFLLRFCFAPEGGLGIGLPASPDLFNCYVAVTLDPLLRGLSEKYGLTYSRYLDDLTFSSDHPIGDKKRKALREAICLAGLEVNHRKSGVYDLTKGNVYINGVGLTKDGRMFLPRSYLRRLNGLIHAAMTSGKIEREVIEGMMGVFKSLTPASPNKTEQETWKRYRRFRRFVGARA